MFFEIQKVIHNGKSFECISKSESNNYSKTFRAVSYTHLDVYKRQVLAYVFIPDEVFPLRVDTLKPFGQADLTFPRRKSKYHT